MIFPPIFAYIIFFILDFISFVFDITGIGAEIGIFITILATVGYYVRSVIKYGPAKTVEKYFKYKGQSKGVVLKKVAKIFGASTIPFLNVWAVYDDYKEEKKESNQKEIQVNTEVKQEKKGSDLKKKILLGAAIAATGGAAAAAVGGEALLGEAAVGEAVAAGEAGAAEGMLSNPWIRKKGADIIKKKAEKTITEEISGIKTGLNREDYDESITDFSKPETYTDLIENQKKDKLEKEKESQRQMQLKKMQGIKAEQSIRQELFDRSKRRFGENANETKEFKESLENKGNDEYREEI